VLGTLPSSINLTLTVAGKLCDRRRRYPERLLYGTHPSGFVRSRDGTFTAISQFADGESAKALVPFAINRGGTLTREPRLPEGLLIAYISDIPEGFVRSPDETNTFSGLGFRRPSPSASTAMASSPEYRAFCFRIQEVSYARPAEASPHSITRLTWRGKWATDFS
jgi:hypothetical protein